MANKLNWEKDGVYWKYSGDVSGEEIIKACTSIYGDPRFDSLDYKVVDFTKASSINMTDEQVAKVAFQDLAAELSNPSIKSAIIMTAAVELAEKFASFFTDSNWEVKIFSDVDTANEWLGREAA